MLYRNWNPFCEMDELGERLNLLLGRGTGEWSPLVDILENDEKYIIKAELPEVEKKDVSVKIEEGVLTISGERRAVKEEKKHRSERSYGRFLRTFRVPENADSTRVSAEFKDGILNVSLPKVVEERAKSIEVSVV